MQSENLNSSNNEEKLKTWCRGMSKYGSQYVDPKRIAIDLELAIDVCYRLLEGVVKEGYGSKYIKIKCPQYICPNSIVVEESMMDEKHECEACGEVFIPRKYIKPSLLEDITFSIDPQYYDNQVHINYDELIGGGRKSIGEKDKIINLKKEKTEVLLQEREKRIEKKKIFLSHCSRDNEVVGKFFKMLKAIGVNNDQIYYSSNETTGAHYFENCLEEIKNEFQNNELLVIFMISREFYDSNVCLAEMGATWVTTGNYVPIILPPLGYDYLQGVVDPMKKGILLKEEILDTKLDTLKEDIEKFLEINNKIALPDWTNEKKSFIEVVKNFESNIKDIEENIKSIKTIDDKIVLKIEMKNNTNNRYEFDEANLTLTTTSGEEIKKTINDWSIKSIVLQPFEKISFYINTQNTESLITSKLNKKKCDISFEYYDAN